ncbi:uncharacterized protein BO88DRAFT_432532 [Aspergillus vadensis CBS 113365]|uniref:Uncharacterized protein n=1 Tax=Aspergillus vadensis (strain CBS 113365 / IMI 142717 / IBT 24658) TaxID=1448311 RepID=A0A319BKB1_ASPVC|nr:hypothetical protein BO88DRAFT_432532 [Aspergillus vadensis CBS 113365]PYH72704.1 hypothetical protein BO88DRAFT_432532 [Aspergillus vadensis CBS 113365]
MCHGDHLPPKYTALNKHAEALQLSRHCFAAPIPNREDYESHDQYFEACDLWNDFVTVGKKMDSTDNRLDYIVAANDLRDLIPTWRAQLSNTKLHSFSLSHADLSANNTFVDDDFNITCIIDWAFSSTVPGALMLAPPALPQSRYELDDYLIQAFRNGVELAITEDTRNEQSKSNKVALEILQQSRFAWLLSRLPNYDSTDDHRLFAAIWRHIYGQEKDASSHYTEKRSSSSFIELYNGIRLEDQPIQKITKGRAGLLSG